MKRINNVYQNIYKIENIIEVANKVCKTTNNKKKVELFQEHYLENIYKIREDLISKTYKPDKYNIFFIYEPKIRLVMSQNFKDKIVNSLVAKYILSYVYEDKLISTTIATRKDKGLHYGIKLTKQYINKMKNNYDDEFYYLKFDIKKYFYNIDHKIVMSMLEEKIKDKNALNIIKLIIDSTDEDYINREIERLKNIHIKKIIKSNLPHKERIIEEIKNIPFCEKGKSLPIGSMLSQIIALIYLDKLNHFIKEELHIKYYILYMDDGVLFHHDKEYLKYCKNEIEKFVKNNLNIELNKKKTKISNIKNGIDFIGYRYYIVDNKIVMKVRNKTKRRFKEKAKKDYKKTKNTYKWFLELGDCKGLIYNSKN